ncbi:MAG: SpoIID/LytB domain protein [Candidatus Magasanikbacteria bacterium GW2011_GWD2_43_18]|nr:MAG: SpoIID/LytB domain protein [Candidatus Magasanikbacteria bacterium GW2011_GWD2_43_18]
MNFFLAEDLFYPPFIGENHIHSTFFCLFSQLETFLIFCYTTIPNIDRFMNKYIAVFLSLFMTTSLFGLTSVRVDAADPKLAIRDSGYAATFVSQSESDPVIIEAGTMKLVKIKFKNTGTKAWVNEGKNFISAYTMEPRERNSVFFGTGWNSPKQIGRMAGTIKPGEVGELGVFLHAPEKVGSYKEEFHLAAENWSWVDDGYFYVDIKVVEVSNVSDVVDVSENVATPEETSATTTYQAKRIGLSKKSVDVVGGDLVSVVAIYQNTGESSWNGYQLTSGSASSLASAGASFADHSWANGNVILAVNDAVEKNGLVRQTFSFRAPKTTGDYTFTAGLHVDGKRLDTFDINVHVTENAPLNYVAFGNSTEVVDVETPRLSEEPRIRVGITTDDQTLQFVSYEDDYRVLNNGVEVGILPQTKIAIMTYLDGVYSFDGSDVIFQTTGVVRLEPVSNPHAVFTLMDVSRPMSWVGQGDFNKYRGVLEYRKGEKDAVLYAVNELFLEDYVKGISETGKGNQFEFVKANLTAARTYAYLSKGKYSFFDVLASTYDQLYLGYNVEVHNPQVAEASAATRGRMVTYEGQVVTTPYFGNSSGYTKSWKTVWGGSEKPWLVPVQATYDLRDGKLQFGHGVGMSQRDANIRAKEEGVDYKALLQYYYTGVEIALMYE